ncbi:MAG: hypothetical protein LBF41_05945 [Deltaproteobacteria bacterium]|nr:hypothetical protein [Deltaproteobacteria bacterium]
MGPFKATKTSPSATVLESVEIPLTGARVSARLSGISKPVIRKSLGTERFREEKPPPDSRVSVSAFAFNSAPAFRVFFPVPVARAVSIVLIAPIASLTLIALLASLVSIAGASPQTAFPASSRAFSVSSASSNRLFSVPTI